MAGDDPENPGKDPQKTQRRTSLLAGLLLGAVALGTYHNVFSAPFVFDDYGSIVNNATIHSLWPPWAAWSPPNDGSGVSGRPLVNFSFALNYAVGGAHVAGYHAVNLALHVISACLLFGLIRRTLERSDARHRSAEDASGHSVSPFGYALAAALLWTVHPLQTESVTCIAQRTELLGTLFLLLTLYCFVRGVERAWKRWAAASIVACTLGMFSKEIVVVAPLLVLLYDRTFVAGGFREAWRGRRRYYVGLAATWAPLAWLVAISGGARAQAAGFGLGISWHGYAIKQIEAICLYLKLAVWPHPLVLDYGAGVAVDPRFIGFEALAVAASLIALVLAVWRRPKVGFLGAASALVLAPSSSVVPLVTQTMAEHRMYLPVIAIIGLLVCILPQRRSWFCGLTVTLVAALAIVAERRNTVYRSELALWTDTVRARPDNPRAHSNLGLELGKLGRNGEAISEYKEALRLRPADPSAHYNLANELARVPGQEAEAVSHYKDALRGTPDSAEAQNNLAMLLARIGHPADAVSHLETAVRLRPGDARLHNNLGMVLRAAGRPAEARMNFEQALAMEPAYAEAHYNLALVLAAVPGQTGDVIAHYEAAVRLRPDYVEAHYNLAVELAKDGGRRREAIREFERVVELSPNLADAWNNLAIQYALDGRTDDATQAFERALTLNPNFESARENLRILRAMQRR